MENVNQPQRFRGRVPRRIALVLLLALIGAAMIAWRPLDWFFVKRALRVKFSDVDWITTTELAAWLNARDRPPPVLLDVRTKPEWQVSHLPAAREIDPAASAEQASRGLTTATPIVTYCSVGYRSAILAERLRKAGFKHVQNLEGSIFTWANEGRPLVREGQRVTRVHPFDATWGRLLRDDVRAPLPQ